MPVNVREADRDQLLLMPPSVADWLPEGHLAWFILDAVKELDRTAFYASYRADGRGGATYSPESMLTVLLYACGVPKPIPVMQPGGTHGSTRRVGPACGCGGTLTGTPPVGLPAP